jgi:hypothetical protein
MAAYDVANYSPGAGYSEPAGDAAPAPAAEPVTTSQPNVVPQAEQPAVVEEHQQHEEHEEQQQEQPEQQQEQPEQQPEPETTPSEPVVLRAPEWIPVAELTPGREAQAAEFSTLGLGQERSQALLDCVTDAATQLQYSFDPDLTSAADAHQEMRRVFGREAGDAMVAEAQKYVELSDPNLGEYLTRTGLGNSVGVLATLSLARQGFFNATPAQARAHIEKLQKTPEWARGDKLTLLRIQVLGRRAEAGSGTNAQLAAAAEAQAAKPAAPAPAVAPTASDARAEAAAMIADKNGPLMSSGHAQHQEAVAKYMALVARI